MWGGGLKWRFFLGLLRWVVCAYAWGGLLLWDNTVLFPWIPVNEIEQAKPPSQAILYLDNTIPSQGVFVSDLWNPKTMGGGVFIVSLAHSAKPIVV